jgi:energy-coupling factor transporter ATP-binding protein EcfA2
MIELLDTETQRTALSCIHSYNSSFPLLQTTTGGLDSSSAVRLIHMLQKIAREQNKTIITTIHQPSSEVFMSFDQLIMLSEGHVVYFGTPKASMAYLQDVAGLPCPPGFNAADFFMDLLVNDTPFDVDAHSSCWSVASLSRMLLSLLLGASTFRRSSMRLTPVFS